MPLITDSASPTATLPKNWKTFLSRLRTILPESRVVDDLSRRIAFSTDASFYHKVPRVVVQIALNTEMQALLSLASQTGIAVTFRAAGTSLSGQAITDSVLVMLTSDWQHAEILENGEKIRLAPGIIGSQANRLLAPLHRKLGPDPASINTCKIGGIAANNASGMCCGVKHNSYHTLHDMQFILADGTLVDTACKASVAAFRRSHKIMLNALSALSDTLRGNHSLAERVRHQFRLKNTLGYGINALLDYTDPVEQLAHLLIGSEGTLAFIASITYRTVPVPRHTRTGLFRFDSSFAACSLIPALKSLNVSAVELMDTRSLRAVAPMLSTFSSQPVGDGQVALLIELSEESGQALDLLTEEVGKALASAGADALCEFTPDPGQTESLWAIRKGLFPAVGAVRETGTTVIIEDVAFPLEVLADALESLTALFSRYHYHEAIIFGHALDGNVHFVFTQRFDTPDERQRYDDFMRDVADMVTRRYNGTLKAEHGTGRNMAPFLTTQWGTQGAELMAKLKHVIDPAGILNPGVIINNNPTAHLKDLKSLPAVDPIVDKCIECGFCEPQCPSKDYTLTPRQRIALMRRQHQRTTDERTQIDSDFTFLGIDSCAATGLCATTCPVGINTGGWVQSLRQAEARHPAIARWPAHHLDGALRAGRFALTAASKLATLTGSERAESFTQKLHATTRGRTPVWLASTPHAADNFALASQDTGKDKVVYVVTCPNRLFASNEASSLPQTVQRLLNKAGYDVVIPDASPSLCCGQPWESKGYPEFARGKASELEAAVSAASENGRWPAVLDASPCAKQAKSSGSQLYELADFLLHHVVPRLSITPLREPLMLHTTCSSTHLDKGRSLRALAALCSNQIIEAPAVTCCGFAGDKGFTQPALNRSALAGLKSAVPPDCKRGVSNSRTCEIGLARHTGINYSHIAFILDEASEALQPEQELS